MAKLVDTGKPLAWPARPPDGRTMTLITEKLKGFTTAANWLPEGMWPELDDLRVEQLRLRGVLVADIGAWHALADGFNTEDQKFAAELRQAYRDGFPPPEDTRTPEAERKAQLRGIEDRLWAGAVVFAEHADLVVATIRENEGKWLADLKSRAADALEKVREAERIAAEARTAQWHVAQLGKWLQNQADDGPFGRQPVPDGSTPKPATVGDHLIANALARPWSRPAATSRPPVVTGIKARLESDDVDEATDAIEPLDQDRANAAAEAGRYRLRDLPRRGRRA